VWKNRRTDNTGENSTSVSTVSMGNNTADKNGIDRGLLSAGTGVRSSAERLSHASPLESTDGLLMD